MKSRIVSFLTILSLVVFTFYLVPHEVVHVFYDHEDTKHEAQHGNAATISRIHIHCDFLTTVIADFVAEDHQQIQMHDFYLPFFYANADVQTVRCVAILRDSRGPPLS